MDEDVPMVFVQKPRQAQSTVAEAAPAGDLDFQAVAPSGQPEGKRGPSKDARAVSLVGHGRAASGETRRWSLDDIHSADESAFAVPPPVVSLTPGTPKPKARRGSGDPAEEWRDASPDAQAGGGELLATSLRLGRVARIQPGATPEPAPPFLVPQRQPAASGDAEEDDGGDGWTVRESDGSARAAWNAGVLLLPEDWDDVAAAKPRGYEQVEATKNAMRSAYAAIISGAALSVAGTFALVIGRVVGH